MPSRYETTREPLVKRMFLGDSAPNKREESILQYIIHCIDEDVRPTSTGGLKMLRGNPRRVRRLPATRKGRRHAAAACEEFEPELVLRGTKERLAPILMTTSATALAVAGSIAGHEIEHPMAIVMLGGLLG